jgi:hypothetical protein
MLDLARLAGLSGLKLPILTNNAVHKADYRGSGRFGRIPSKLLAVGPTITSRALTLPPSSQLLRIRPWRASEAPNRYIRVVYHKKTGENTGVVSLVNSVQN